MGIWFLCPTTDESGDGINRLTRRSLTFNDKQLKLKFIKHINSTLRPGKTHPNYFPLLNMKIPLSVLCDILIPTHNNSGGGVIFLPLCFPVRPRLLNPLHGTNIFLPVTYDGQIKNIHEIITELLLFIQDQARRKPYIIKDTDEDGGIGAGDEDDGGDSGDSGDSGDEGGDKHTRPEMLTLAQFKERCNPETSVCPDDAKKKWDSVEVSDICLGSRVVPPHGECYKWAISSDGDGDDYSDKHFERTRGNIERLRKINESEEFDAYKSLIKGLLKNITILQSLGIQNRDLRMRIREIIVQLREMEDIDITEENKEEVVPKLNELITNVTEFIQAHLDITQIPSEELLKSTASVIKPTIHKKKKKVKKINLTHKKRHTARASKTKSKYKYKSKSKSKSKTKSKTKSKSKSKTNSKTKSRKKSKFKKYISKSRRRAKKKLKRRSIKNKRSKQKK